MNVLWVYFWQKVNNYNNEYNLLLAFINKSYQKAIPKLLLQFQPFVVNEITRIITLNISKDIIFSLRIILDNLLTSFLYAALRWHTNSNIPNPEDQVPISELSKCLLENKNYCILFIIEKSRKHTKLSIFLVVPLSIYLFIYNIQQCHSREIYKKICYTKHLSYNIWNILYVI